MTSILGISAFYHDSAAALVVDGKIISAVQEERFSRKKHDARYPFNSINYILKDSGLKLKDLITEQSSLEKIFVELVKENNEI